MFDFLLGVMVGVGFGLWWGDSRAGKVLRGLARKAKSTIDEASKT